jgi:hypothetical protein
MKNVLIKNSKLLLFVLLVSCHRTVKNSPAENSKNDKKKAESSLSIITNSLDPNFVYDLIETQKVEKGDTILFREWETNHMNPISINNNNKKYEIFGDTLSKFYKTGEEKFSKYKITISNKTEKKAIDIYGIVICNNFREAYHQDQSSATPKMKKLSKTIGRFEFECLDENGLFVDFKVINDNLQIIKLSSEKYMKKEIVKHKLDTLIILTNSNYIYPDSLLFVLNKKKNCIAGKGFLYK